MTIVSADHFFMHDGVYKFDAAKISTAHHMCLKNFLHFLPAYDDVLIMRGIPGAGKGHWIEKNVPHKNMIVVDNTNVNLTEIAPYAALALAYEKKVQVVTVSCNPEIAFRRNVHGVPEDRIRSMNKYLWLETWRMPPWWPHKVVGPISPEEMFRAAEATGPDGSPRGPEAIGLLQCGNCNGYGSSLKEAADQCTKCGGIGLLRKDDVRA